MKCLQGGDRRTRCRAMAILAMLEQGGTPVARFWGR